MYKSKCSSRALSPRNCVRAKSKKLTLLKIDNKLNQAQITQYKKNITFGRSGEKKKSTKNVLSGLNITFGQNSTNISNPAFHTQKTNDIELHRSSLKKFASKKGLVQEEDINKDITPSDNDKNVRTKKFCFRESEPIKLSNLSSEYRRRTTAHVMNFHNCNKIFIYVYITIIIIINNLNSITTLF